MKSIYVAGLLAATALASGDLPVVDLGYERHQAIAYNVSSSPLPTTPKPTETHLTRLIRKPPAYTTSPTSATLSLRSETSDSRPQ